MILASKDVPVVKQMWMRMAVRYQLYLSQISRFQDHLAPRMFHPAMMSKVRVEELVKVKEHLVVRTGNVAYGDYDNDNVVTSESDPCSYVVTYKQLQIKPRNNSDNVVVDNDCGGGGGGSGSL